MQEMAQAALSSPEIYSPGEMLLNPTISGYLSKLAPQFKTLLLALENGGNISFLDLL